jgi:hypothetical protein
LGVADGVADAEAEAEADADGEADGEAEAEGDADADGDADGDPDGDALGEPLGLPKAPGAAAPSAPEGVIAPVPSGRAAQADQAMRGSAAAAPAMTARRVTLLVEESGPRAWLARGPGVSFGDMIFHSVEAGGLECGRTLSGQFTRAVGSP